MKWLLFAIILAGCETVEISERVIYEDSTPVVDAKVIQWNDTYKGTTRTDENGNWSLNVPPDTVINLCIENPQDNNAKCCYQEDGLLTPPLNGGDKMIRI